jgi:molybdopterin converting factor small subunit
MKIYIRMFGRFKHQIWERKEVDVKEGVTPMEVLRGMIAVHSAGYSAIFDDQDQIRNHIILMINQKRISHANSVSVLLKEADEIAVLPPVAGG